jgi:uncharacterized protein YndB with AHSA1/START domain
MNTSLERCPERVCSGTKPFVFTRTINAPRAAVWQAWTERSRLMRWFGPKGFTMPAAKLDFRPGGSFHYCLSAPNGNEMWGKFVYREIEPLERIVLVSSFSDEDGNITRHPLSAAWPLEMLSTTTFTEAAGQTDIRLEWEPLNPTDEERQTFEASHDGMKHGWIGTFQQLEAYLAQG